MEGDLNYLYLHHHFASDEKVVKRIFGIKIKAVDDN